MAEGENVVKRVKPHDDKAERGVIASMLMDREAISDVSALLNKEDFYNAQYGYLYEAIVTLYNEGKAVDEILLAEQLKKMGLPEEITGLNYLGEILADTQTSAFAKQYAEIIRNKSYLRKLIKASEDHMKMAYEGKGEVDEILEIAEQDMFTLVQGRSGKNDFDNIRQVVVDVIGDIEAATKTRGRVNGLRTGFKELDNMLTGLHGGELILVAARPSMGKTAFVLNIAHHVAYKERIPVAMFSLEMSSKQLVTRLVAVDSMVDAKSIKTGDLKDGDWTKIIESTNNIANSPIFIMDNSAITISEMRSKCRKLKQQEDIGLIIIDYLQLMSAAGRVESRQLFIAEVSRALKSIARELDVPVIAMSQLSRAVDSRPDHKPVLADLRESGAIEQDADVVMFIYRDDYYNPETTEKPGVAEIIIAKQRNGSTGPIELAWISKYTKFANLSIEKSGGTPPKQG